MQAMKVNEREILQSWTHLVIYKGGSPNRGAISEANLLSTEGEFHKTLQDMGIIASRHSQDRRSGLIVLTILVLRLNSEELLAVRRIQPDLSLSSCQR